MALPMNDFGKHNCLHENTLENIAHSNFCDVIRVIHTLQSILKRNINAKFIIFALISCSRDIRILTNMGGS